MKERMPLDLRRIYDEHAPALFAFLLNVTRNETDTRDLLQELFVKLGAQPGILKGVREERSYLFRLAHNLAIDAFRRQAGRVRHLERAAAESTTVFAPATDPDEHAFRTAMEASLTELPAEQRAVLHLKLWGNLTFVEIAETLGISPNTAASRYRYGLDKLQTLLRPLYEELP